MPEVERPSAVSVEGERLPSSEVVGGLAAVILFLASSSLPLAAMWIFVRTPLYEGRFRAPELVLPWATAFFLNPACRAATLATCVAAFGGFLVAWMTRRIQALAILAPVLFLLALALMAVWVSAMHGPPEAGVARPPDYRSW